MDLTEQLREQIRLYLAAENPRNVLADWLALHAQELSDLAHDGRWEFQADVWTLVWQVEERSIDEVVFARELGELLPRNPAIEQSWPPDARERTEAKATSGAVTLKTEPLTRAGVEV